MQPRSRLHRRDRLQGDSDGNSDTGMSAVEQVVTVIDVADVDVVGVVPVVRPGFRPRVNETEPIAAILEPGISADDTERATLDTKPMLRPKVSTESRVGDSITLVAATLLPGAVVRLPAPCAMLLPSALPDALSFLDTLRSPVVLLSGMVPLIALRTVLCDGRSGDS